MGEAAGRPRKPGSSPPVSQVVTAYAVMMVGG